MAEARFLHGYRGGNGLQSLCSDRADEGALVLEATGERIRGRSGRLVEDETAGDSPVAERRLAGVQRLDQCRQSCGIGSGSGEGKVQHCRRIESVRADIVVDRLVADE